MSPIQQALDLAQRRGLLPTSMGTAEMRALATKIRDQAFWSARTSNAAYLAELKKLVERYVKGEGYDNDLGQLRVEARELLAKYGYMPERGFPGDASLGIPAARPGSLQDLSSERRLTLIYETQASLMRGLGLKMRGIDRVSQYPAWELVRVESRRVPRDWEERWAKAGGRLIQDGTSGRMMARKDDDVWSALGDSSLFDDALDVDYPPFAFQSGMGWREVPAAEWARLVPGSTPPAPAAIPPAVPAQIQPPTPPRHVRYDDFIGGKPTVDNLIARLRARRAREGA